MAAGGPCEASMLAHLFLMVWPVRPHEVSWIQNGVCRSKCSLVGLWGRCTV